MYMTNSIKQEQSLKISGLQNDNLTFYSDVELCTIKFSDHL